MEYQILDSANNVSKRRLCVVTASKLVEAVYDIIIEGDQGVSLLVQSVSRRGKFPHKLDVAALSDWRMPRALISIGKKSSTSVVWVVCVDK
jgi:hypothetical protein